MKFNFTDGAMGVISTKQREKGKDSLGMVLDKELQKTDSRIQRQLKGALHFAEDVITNTSELSPGHTSYEWGYVESFGRAKLIGSGANDIPLVEMGKRGFIAHVRAYALGFEVTTQELDSMALIGMPIRSDKASAVARGFAETFNQIAYFGEGTATGLLNNADVATVQVALNAATTSRLWANKTQTERYTDVVTAWQQQIVAANGESAVHPNTLLMPLSHIGFMKARMSVDNPETLEEAIRKAITCEIKYRSELQGTFAGATNGFCLYRKSADFGEFMVAKDVTPLADQASGLSIKAFWEARNAGFILRFPVAYRYAIGI